MTATADLTVAQRVLRRRTAHQVLSSGAHSGADAAPLTTRRHWQAHPALPGLTAEQRFQSRVDRGEETVLSGWVDVTGRDLPGNPSVFVHLDTVVRGAKDCGGDDFSKRRCAPGHNSRAAIKQALRGDLDLAADLRGEKDHPLHHRLLPAFDRWAG